MVATTANKDSFLNASLLQNLFTALLKICNYAATQKVVGLSSIMNYENLVNMHKLVTSRKVQCRNSSEKDSIY